MCPTSADGAYRIRRYRAQDRPVLIAIIGEVWGGQAAARMEALWDWKFERNPQNPPRGHDSLVIDFQGEAVGFLGFLSANVKLDDRVVNIAWGSEMALHPRHRGQGYLLFKFIGEQAEKVIAGNAGIPEVYALETRFGAFEVARWVNLKRVLRPLPFARSRVGNPLLSAVGAAVLGAHARLTAPRPVADSPLVTPLDRFDARFDAFWRRVSPGYRFIGVRDTAFLNWRFCECPNRRYEIFAATGRDEVAGYVVVRREEPRQGSEGLHRGLIVDILVARDDRRTFAALIARAVDHFREQGVELASCTLSQCNGDYLKMLRHNGFRLRTRGIPLTAFESTGPDRAALKAAFRDARDLFLTRADTDLDYNY